MQLTHVESQKSTSTARPRNWRKLSGGEFSHTRPISGARTVPFSTLMLGPSFLEILLFGGSQFFSDEFGAVLRKILMLRGESRGKVAVDIQLTHYLSMDKQGHYDLRFSF